MKIIQRNWQTKLLSLIVAIFLWSFIIANENPTITTKLSSIPVVLENTEDLDSKGLILSEGYQKTVDITISGKRNNIMSVTPSHIRATLDFRRIDEGTHKINVQYSLPEGITLEDGVNTIDVNIEKIISKDFAVKVQTSGKLQENYVLESTSVSPEKITIRGSRTNVEKINNLVTTIDLENLVKDTTINSAIKAVNQEGTTIENITYGQQFVNINIGVSKQKEVELELNTIGNLKSEYRLISSILNKSKVQIKGPKYKVDGIDKITTQEINLSSVTKSSRIPVKLSLPSDIVLVNQDQDFFVDFEIEEKIDKTLDIPKTNIKVNKTSLLKSDISNDSIQIILNGFAEDLEKINVDNIELIVDANGKFEGLHSISPEIKVNGKPLEKIKVKNVETVKLILRK